MDPIETELVVLGAGPGGYAAAFYAADLGKKVLLVEQDKQLGGVCLNRGCIPSKALLHAAKMIVEARESAQRGITFGPPQIELDKLRAWKNSIVERLAAGVAFLAKKRGVQVLTGRGYFESSQTLRVETPDGQQFVNFEKAIIAVGSNAALPKAFDLGNPRVMTSTEALEVEEVPEDLLVIGGGYIGMELGSVYANLGSKVVVVEAPGLHPHRRRPRLGAAHFQIGADQFSRTPFQNQGRSHGDQGEKNPRRHRRAGQNAKGRTFRPRAGFRRPRAALPRPRFGKHQSRAGRPRLHQSQRQAGNRRPRHPGHRRHRRAAFCSPTKPPRKARIAVETIVGESSTSAGVIIPAVVFTDPELAWCGLTEAEAKARDIPVEIAKFPWAASGRAQTFDHPERPDQTDY